MTPLRYSEITPELHAALRVLAAVEKAYPQVGDRSQRTLAGFEEWRMRSRSKSRPPAPDQREPADGNAS